jgi:hypothetical protein
MAIGKHQCRLLDFAFNNQNWHSYNKKCRNTKRALWALHLKGAIVFNAFDQFKINLNEVQL